jgi:hypothetical protein
MEIKNINIIKSSPIVVTCNDGALISIPKVPAKATLALYLDEELIEGLSKLSKLDAVLKSNKTAEVKSAALKSSTRDTIKLVKAHFDTIIEVLEYALKKNREWIDENLGPIEMIQIISAIMLKNSEESADLIKKNNLM